MKRRLSYYLDHCWWTAFIASLTFILITFFTSSPMPWDWVALTFVGAGCVRILYFVILEALRLNGRR